MVGHTLASLLDLSQLPSTKVAGDCGQTAAMTPTNQPAIAQHLPVPGPGLPETAPAAASTIIPPVARALVCVALAAAVHQALPASDSVRAGMALFTLIGGLWVTQALHLSITALLVPLLAVLAGVLPPRQALAPFADPVIFLFMGGFALAAALGRHGLDRALADSVLRIARGRRWPAVLLLAGATAFLSMWMSNTATVAIMLPLALGLLQMEGSASRADERTRAFVLLALAYSASIGGMATPIGSPPNAIAAAHAGIGFAQWMGVAMPIAAVLWPAMLVVLALTLRPRLGGRVVCSSAPLQWTRGRIATVAIFILSVAGWAGGAPLARALGIDADIDTVIALAAIAALAATDAINWSDLERRVQWGVLLLFGGGIALSDVMATSGASRHLAQALLSWTAGAHPAILVLMVVLFVVFLTELVSNTASAALLLPIFVPVASAMGLPPAAMAGAIAISASCAFMLPVATPPNALVFGTGHVSQATMMRSGFLLNGVSIAVIAASLLWRSA